MIYIKDDFLNPELIDLLNNDTSEFVEVKKPGKSFWVKIPSKEFLDLVISKVEELENNSIECILGFFREAKLNQDDDWNIHNDSIVEGQQPDRALVLFISDNLMFFSCFLFENIRIDFLYSGTAITCSTQNFVIKYFLVSIATL